MKLYDLEISGNCYKIRLFLAVLGIEYTRIPVDVKAGENKTSEFLEMNPNGLVPVLTDGATTIYDSAAILVYLAKTYADEEWLPGEPIQLSSVVRWLAFEQSEVRYGLCRARAKLLNMPTPLAQLGTLEDSQALARQALDILEKQLTQNDWLAGGLKPTICDIACYPYTAMGPEGGVSLQPYTAVRRWMEKIESLDGYIALPGQVRI
ncbi:MAG: glutathione S-transferase family protein [Gammaproteobacteria bacterium]|nr:glutathione S-transferase family protein [Gammaproteobacteria bacterium]